MNNRSWKSWWMFTIGWFILTAAAIFLSEKFKDIDAVLYPSTFILILSLLIGPGSIGLLLPLSSDGKWNLPRGVVLFITYIICFGLIRLFSFLCFRLQLL